MSDNTIFGAGIERNHIDRLCEIAQLAKVAAAASETTFKVSNLPAAQGAVFQLIHVLACEALETADQPNDFPKVFSG